MHTTRWEGGTALACATLLGGCAGMGDNSNPTLSIQSASVRPNSADVKVLVVNQSDHQLTLTAIDYELVLGPLPVASAIYKGSHALTPDGSANFNLHIPFDHPALDPDAGELTLTGVMRFDHPGAGSDMKLRSASFNATADVR